MSQSDHLLSLGESAPIATVRDTNRVVVVVDPSDQTGQGAATGVVTVAMDDFKDYLLEEVDTRLDALEAGGGGGGGTGGLDTTAKTATITSGAGQILGSVNLAKLGIITKVASDQPMRLRLYPTATERDTDLPRSASTASTPGNSLLFEGITVPGLLSFHTGPTPFIYNGDTPVSAAIYYTLEPTAGQGAVCTLTYNGFA